MKKLLLVSDLQEGTALLKVLSSIFLSKFLYSALRAECHMAQAHHDSFYCKIHRYVCHASCALKGTSSAYCI